MIEVLSPLLVFGFAFGVHQAVLNACREPFEQRLLTQSFAAHMGSAIALVLVYTYYYPGGDMTIYRMFAIPIADALRADFGAVAPEVWQLFIQGDYRLPLDVFGMGSTGTMQSLSVVLMFLLGDSLYAAALLIALGSYLAKVLVYHALRDDFSRDSHSLVLLAISLSPSGIVWTCALLKEPIIMVAFGPFLLALRWLLEGRRIPLAIAILAVSGGVILLLKPYVVLAGAGAGGVWIFWSRTLKSGTSLVVKPIYLVLSLIVVGVGFSAASAVFPNLSPDRLAESVQTQRRAASMSSGGSNFELEGPQSAEAEERSAASQVSLIPLALVTALFRPFVFESFSLMQFLNAIEMTWLTYLFWKIVRENRFVDLLDRITRNPSLMFCLVFVLVLALGTGLSTANLGALSRYRAPMMPFFLLLLLALRKPEHGKQATRPNRQITTERA